MESKILKILTQNWIFDNRISAFVEDTDSKNNKVCRGLNWKFARRIDTYHQNEHFKAFLKEKDSKF